jgi:hypothetical protein
MCTMVRAHWGAEHYLCCVFLLLNVTHTQPTIYSHNHMQQILEYSYNPSRHVPMIHFLPYTLQTFSISLSLNYLE